MQARFLLALQSTAGNRAVAGLVQRRQPSATSTAHELPGRRKTRQGVWKHSVVLKVTIAGSGHNLWSTHGAGAKPPGWDRKKLDGGPRRYERSKEAGGPVTEISYAGPGAKDATWGAGGLSDTGSNRIAELIEHVPDRVVDLLNEIHAAKPETQKQPTVILIRAHSRGAVAAAQVARNLKARLAGHKALQIELVMFDPVPGPGHKGKNVKLDLSDVGLSEFTLVYSVGSGYLGIFSPQAVYGAKRIIITKEKHKAKTDVGFVYQGNRYRGSNLNSLPRGVYVDYKTELVKVDDIASAKAKLKEARAATPNITDRKRKDRIVKVLDDYYANAT